MVFAMLNTQQRSWYPRPGHSVAAGTMERLSADTVVVDQRPGFRLLMRGMEKKMQIDDDSDKQAVASEVKAELTRMHEANTAIIVKMARWTKAALNKRDAPYMARHDNIAFVSPELGINPITGTTFPRSINTDPETDDDSDEDLYNPNAFPKSSDAAQAPQRAGHREMAVGQVYLARSSVISEATIDVSPDIQEVDTLPQLPKEVATTEQAQRAVDTEEKTQAHLPIDNEFSQENVDRLTDQPEGQTSVHGPPPSASETRSPAQQMPIPRARSQKRERSPANTAGGASSAGHAAPPVPNLRIADRVATEELPTGAVPRYSPVGDTESSADHDEMDAETTVMRSLPRAADIGLGEELAYNSVDPDEETQKTYQDYLVGSTPIAEGVVPPVSVAAPSRGGDVLPTPRTATAEALSKLSLDRSK